MREAFPLLTLRVVSLVLALTVGLLIGCASFPNPKPTIVTGTIDVTIQCFDSRAHIVIEAKAPGSFAFRLNPMECGKEV